MASKSPNWSEEECLAMIAIWADDNIQSQLIGGIKRNIQVYRRMADRLNRECGCDPEKTGEQIRTKIKNFKRDHKDAVDNNNRSGRGRKGCRFFCELDAILGHTPTISPLNQADTDEEMDANQVQDVYQFIESLQQTPSVWDVKSKDYMDTIKRGEDIAKLSKQFGLTGMETVRKYNSLRTHFQKEKKKVMDSRRNGTANDSTYTSKWPYFEALSYLDDPIESKATTETLVSKASIEHLESKPSIESFEPHPNDILSSMMSEGDCCVFHEEEKDVCIVGENNGEYKNNEEMRRKRKRENGKDLTSALIQTATSLTNYLKGQSCSDAFLSSSKDEISCFTSMLGHQLRSIQNELKRRKVMIEIQSLLLDKL